MELKTRQEKNATVVSIKGRMDSISSPEFEKEVSELMAEGQINLIVDFGELDYISSAGLRSILAVAKKLENKEGKLLLSALKDMVKEVFEITGFAAIIPVYESVESALAHI